MPSGCYTNSANRFNPRPAARPGESGAHLGGCPEAEEFQSTPGRSAGRIPGKRGGEREPSQFQSTPGRSAGRISIQSRGVTRVRGFNPRPAARPGESPNRADRGLATAVSIHARPLGRANLAERYPIKARGGEFQSTPGRSAGRIT
uniref:Uncharacterized protein n=1 Tax=mine drainage metagenome TaxID=410659 RepID=E6PG26_9ZZZZ